MESGDRPSIPDSFAFDESKIATADSPEKKEVVLFLWLSALERDLRRSNRDAIKPFQAVIEKLLLKYLSSTNPKPSGPVRQSIARCYISLFTNGDSRTVFDILTALQAFLSKKTEDPAVRLAVIHCTGVISGTHGCRVLSLFAETLTSLTKLLRNAKEQDLTLRYECLVALARSIRACGRSANDALLKDINRIAKAGLTDKFMLIRGAAAEVLQAILRFAAPTIPPKFEEYDVMFSQYAKSMESSNSETRRLIASAISAMLVISQNKTPQSKSPATRSPAKPTPVADASVTEKSLLTVQEMLNLTTNQLLKTTARDVKVGIIEAYAAMLHELGFLFVETNYSLIVKHILDLSANPKLSSSRREVIFMRQLCEFMLRDVVGKMLSESGQVNAVRELTNMYLKKYPPVLPTDVEPNRQSLICVLNEVAVLLLDLGSAATQVQDVVTDPLMSFINHPSASVNVALSWCLRCLCAAVPTQLPKLMHKLGGLVQREIPILTSERPELIDRWVGWANCLAGVIGGVSSRSLYVSFDMAAKIFVVSTQLLKSVINHPNIKDWKLATAQVQVAWTLMGSLMTLGPNFVKVHLSQFLLIWKAVLSKVTSKEGGPAVKSEAEWTYLLSSRDHALAALYSFLLFNRKDLVTNDVAKRLVVCLNTVVGWLSTLPPTYPISQQSAVPTVPNTTNNAKLVDREHTVRRRLFQCFTLLPPSTYETIFPVLIKATQDVFAREPEKLASTLPTGPVDKGASVAIDSTSLTSLTRGLVINVASDSGAEDRGWTRAVSQDTDIANLKAALENQHPHATEYDPHCIYFYQPSQHISSSANEHSSAAYEVRYVRPSPVAPSIAVIDAAIELFSIVFPFESAATQEGMLEQFIRTSKYTGAKMSPGKKLATQLNVLVAVIGALKRIMVKQGSFASGRSAVAIRDLTDEALTSAEPSIRSAGSEVLGRLARTVGTAIFINPLIQGLVDQVVNNRDPVARSGYALALGYINSYVGGMAAASHIKTIVGILHSLAADPHPLVHTWALHALWLTVESSGLMYEPYVNSTLLTVARLFMSDTHEIPYLAANQPGGDTNADVYPTFGRILHALVGVVGPELQDGKRVRELCFGLYEALRNDSDPFVVVEAIKCVQHFILFAPKHVDIASLVPFLQVQLAGDYKSHGALMRKASVTCLYQLVQRNPESVLAAAMNSQLEEQLFALLDTEMDGTVCDETRDILMGLLRHVAPTRPSRWLELCKSILSKSAPPVPAASAADGSGNSHQTNDAAGSAEEYDDDEGFGVRNQRSGYVTPPGASAAAPQANPGLAGSFAAIALKLMMPLLPRWRTQIFALACLRQTISVAKSTGVKAHFDLEIARNAVSTGGRVDYLVLKLADLVRMAFSASTGTVDALRLEGLLVLQDILEKFGDTADPDYDDHALLEQYQAQISAALAPNFSPDTSPEVMSAACRVCAVYIGSGINKSLGALGRVLKVWVGTLDRCQETNDLDGERSSPHITLMLRLAIVTAWADLQIASTTHPYLIDIVGPNLPVLVPLWMSVLRDHAKIKLETDSVSPLAAAATPDSGSSLYMYTSSTLDVVLPYYLRSWHVVMQAFTALIDVRDDLIVAAIRESDPNAAPSDGPTNTYFVLYGLCMEAIANSGLRGSSASQRDGDKIMISCLGSIAQLCRPKIAGKKFLPKGVFMETISIFDRLLQTEELPVQLLVVRIVQRIFAEYGDEYFLDDAEVYAAGNDFDLLTGNVVDAGPLANYSRLYVTIKLLFNGFMYQVPSLSNNPTATVNAYRKVTPDTADFLAVCLETLTALVCSPGLTSAQKAEIMPIPIYIYLTLLKSDRFTADVGPRVLVCLKACMENIHACILSLEEPVVAKVLQAGLSTLIDSVQDELEESADSTDPFDHTMIKNCLLAVTLVTTTEPKLSHHHDTQERFVKTLKRFLNTTANESLSFVALQCTRSLLGLFGRHEAEAMAIGAMYARLLLPEIVAFICTMANQTLSSTTWPRASLLDDALKCILVLYALLPDEHKKISFLPVLVPLMVSVITPVPESGPPAFPHTAATTLQSTAVSSLLQIAGTHPVAFRSSIASLPDAERVKLERALRYNLSRQNSAVAQPSLMLSRTASPSPEMHSAPKIQLRASFGDFS
ncbi:hypothetical protein SeMB42_g03131 [Synchytrium endobioticum]|uniref:LAA1-like C-terminal TPR repeats domain-containing protein n=1 Tax=Synchytrium endobioticum TaxID=286115 RepID=A0A507D0K9_9FUNG|nr:hypothetical protein SeLEV6574_g04171 [Synchytrium endobioticum]TPX48122.1 hypothetical protein SeMB42_g03131 [Synchytrium endobioticum]